MSKVNKTIKEKGLATAYVSIGITLLLGTLGFFYDRDSIAESRIGVVEKDVAVIKSIIETSTKTTASDILTIRRLLELDKE